MILRFRAKIGYKSRQNVLILLKNLALVIEDPSHIDNKLVKDIQLCRVISVPTPIAHLISLPLSLVHSMTKTSGKSTTSYILKRSLLMTTS